MTKEVKSQLFRDVITCNCFVMTAQKVRYVETTAERTI